MPPRRPAARPTPLRASSASLGAALGAALAAACGGGDGGRPPSALLVTLDTTRADALSCYGTHRGVTPSIDRLAAEGVLYEAAYTVAPLTLPAHASILSGLYPIRHGARENGLWPLPEEAETLAERARAAGFQTAAFVAAVVLDEGYGLDQGFDVYDAPARPARQTTSHYAERPADEVVDAALAWLAARDRDRPFLLWVHLFDPHAPYEPPVAFRGGPWRDRPYLGEVGAADAAVGRLVATLEDEGLLDETIVAVAGDHGEAFGEHGEVSHGALCYEPTLRVPLVVRHPHARRAGERSGEIVSVVDLYPTLAEAMGLDVPAGLDGTSLLGRVPDGRGVYFESYAGWLSLGWSPLAGWRDREGKYLHSSDPELYDVERDPAERRDLAAERPEDVERCRRALALVAGRPRLASSGPAAPDDETVDELRALGYAALGTAAEALPEPLAPTDRPSPRERIDEHRETLAALARFNAGETEEAMETFGRIVRESPRNLFVLDLYAHGLMRLGRHAEAASALERLLREGPARADSVFNLGVCLRELGRGERALETFRRALERDPLHRGALVAAMELCAATDHLDEAERYRRRLESLAGEGGAR